MLFTLLTSKLFELHCPACAEVVENYRIFYEIFLGSGPVGGQSPVERGNFPYFRISVAEQESCCTFDAFGQLV